MNVEKTTIQPIEVSLSYFIRDNDKLLTTIGVFIAVIALTDQSQNWLLKMVAFASLGGLLLVGWEVWSKLQRLKQSPRLFLFSYVINIGGLSFVIYWLYRFRPLWDFVLWLPLTLVFFALVLTTLLPLVKKFGFTRTLFGINLSTRNKYQKTARTIALAILLLFSLFQGVYWSVGINLIFDIIHKSVGQG